MRTSLPPRRLVMHKLFISHLFLPKPRRICDRCSLINVQDELQFYHTHLCNFINALVIINRCSNYFYQSRLACLTFPSYCLYWIFITVSYLYNSCRLASLIYQRSHTNQSCAFKNQIGLKIS